MHSMKIQKQRNKNGRGRETLADTAVFNVRLRLPVMDRLREQAQKEDRSMAYLVAVFVQDGLDNRGARDGNTQ